MKAALLKAFGQPLELVDLPDPQAGPGEAVVEIVAARVLSYMREIVSGARAYAFELPAVPGAGAVGRIRELGPDATRLKVGDWVLCDPTLRSRDDALTPDIALQGLVGRGPGGAKLQRRFPNGSYAELMLAPLENLHPLGEVGPAEASRWLGAGTMLVPYGGLLAVDFRPGETLVVSGATGNFGGAAAMLAAALFILAGWVQLSLMYFATGGYEAAVKALAAEISAALDASDGMRALFPDMTSEQLAQVYVQFSAVALSTGATLMQLANLYLAARSVQLSQRLNRPWRDIPSGFHLPRWLAAPTVAALALALVGPSPFDDYGLVATGALGVLYTLQGLAALHALSRRAAARRSTNGPKATSSSEARLTLSATLMSRMSPACRLSRGAMTTPCRIASSGEAMRAGSPLSRSRPSRARPRP